MSEQCNSTLGGYELSKVGSMRQFPTGATRDADQDKPDYEGYLSPLVIAAYGRYMTKHRRQTDGSLRASDNWQKGIPLDAYVKSGWRHFLDWWSAHRGWDSRAGMEDALCGLLFNVMGYLHEWLQCHGAPSILPDLPDANPGHAGHHRLG